MTADFRVPTASKWQAPRAVADGGGGTIIATAEVAGCPDRVFRALTTNEVERWWGQPNFYRQTGCYRRVGRRSARESQSAIEALDKERSW